MKYNPSLLPPEEQGILWAMMYVADPKTRPNGHEVLAVLAPKAIEGLMESKIHNQPKPGFIGTGTGPLPPVVEMGRLGRSNPIDLSRIAGALHEGREDIDEVGSKSGSESGP